MLLSTTYANLKSIISTTSGAVKYLVANIRNMRAVGNEDSYIKILNPYGFCSYPRNDNSLMLVTPINASNKDYAIMGWFQGMPDNITHIPVAGETWQYSTKYLFIQQVDGVRAYRNDNKFSATMPNGESFVTMMTDRINELEDMITKINANYTTLVAKFNSHTHVVANVQPGSSSITASSTGDTLSQTAIPVYPTLAKDKAYLPKALVNNDGEMYA